MTGAAAAIAAAAAAAAGETTLQCAAHDSHLLEGTSHTEQ